MSKTMSPCPGEQQKKKELTMLHHDSEKPDNYFRRWTNEDLSLSSLLCIVDTFKGICQDIHTNHGYDLVVKLSARNKIRVGHESTRKKIARERRERSYERGRGEHERETRSRKGMELNQRHLADHFQPAISCVWFESIPQNRIFFCSSSLHPHHFNLCCSLFILIFFTPREEISSLLLIKIT